MTHPIRRYLQQVGETVPEFAARVGASRQTLYRIANGAQRPKPDLARRIVEATGGVVTLDAIYTGGNSTAAKIVDLKAGGDDNGPDCERIKLAMAIVINHMTPQETPPPPSEAVEIAAEAVVNTYIALASVTTRQGEGRLGQALRPVLEEILKDYGDPPPSSVLDRGAELAAQLYFQPALWPQDAG